MGRARAGRVAWCAGTLLLAMAADAAGDVRLTPPRERSGHEERLRGSAARLAAQAPIAPIHAAPLLEPRWDARPGPLLPPRGEERPRPLIPLYASFATLQALDAHSTLAAIEKGGSEANPLVAPLADRPGVMFGVKAAAALTTIALAEKLWRRNRAAAVIVMVAANAGYAAIVARNYRQAGRSARAGRVTPP